MLYQILLNACLAIAMEIILLNVLSKCLLAVEGNS